MRRQKATLFVLVSLLLMQAGVSCSSQKTENEDSSTQPLSADVTSAVTETETTAKEDYEAPEIKDLGGYHYRIMTDLNDASGTPLFFTDELTGDSVNDAIFNRNKKVEDTYNVVIDYIDQASSSVKKSVTAGDDSCDICSPFANEGMTMVRHGYFLDMNTISTLNLDNPWWDQRIRNQLSVFGQVYMMTGDITLRSTLCEFVIQYNKSIYEEYDFEDPYEMVRNGTWTSDKLMDMSKQISADINGDGTMDASDMWGFVSETSAPYYFFAASGNTTIESSQNTYKLTIDDDKTYNSLEKAVNFMLDSGALCVDDGKFKCIAKDNVWAEAYYMFTSNRTLFRSSALGDLLEYRDMKMDYGLLPIPKQSEDQDGYYCLVSCYDSPIMIPITVSDPEKTGLITEALAYESHFDLRKAFLDQLLSGKIMRDDASTEMLELIISSKTYDLDYVSDITGMFGIVADIVKSKKDVLSSKIAAVSPKVQTKLDKFLADFKDLE